MKYLLLICFAFLTSHVFAQTDSTSIRDNYTKKEVYITMRDGVRLFTNLYIPKDSSQSYPFLINRTPYSIAPYGENVYAKEVGPNSLFIKERYIFVNQDVRGKHLSEGVFEEMTPAINNDKQDNNKEGGGTDESSDTYDTVDWLLKNISHNNGKAGLYGISYPGFYSTASLPNAHPAIKAVSPQAPVTDEFEGDDVYHRGAFFLMDNFSFENIFDAPRDAPRQVDPLVNDSILISDVYDFYRQAGALHNYNDLYYHHQR